MKAITSGFDIYCKTHSRIREKNHLLFAQSKFSRFSKLVYGYKFSYEVGLVFYLLARAVKKITKEYLPELSSIHIRGIF